MNTLLSLLLLLAACWAVFYIRTTLVIGTVSVAITLLVIGQALKPAALFLVLAWLVFAAVAVSLNVRSLRRRWFSNPALEQFRRIMPSMSQTEREALDAGTVWWDGQLFSGKPDWKQLLNTPAAKLSAEEQAFIDGPAQQLCEMLDDWTITHIDNDLSPEVWQFIKEQGFLGMIIPKRYGGLEFSAYAHSCVVMKVAGRSITAAVSIMVPNSLGPAELLLRYGTDEQKDRYLSNLAKGVEMPCFALTSPEAGSDAASMTDTGVVCHAEFNGQKDVLGIRLNWEKRYITLGPIATVLGLAFKLYDPDKLLGDKTELGITCALIPTDTPGVQIGKRHFPLDSAFQNGPNWGKDVFIPIDWIIGGRQYAGQGWRMLMECLAAGRSISLPALSTGAGKLVSRATGAYSVIRRQFKLPISRFEGIEEVLARIAGTTYMMDAARTLTACAIDQGESPSVISAIVKYHLTESMRTVLNDAMDVHGGHGICLGPRNVIGRAYQTVPVSITVEGANILTRTLIIFGQGAIRCHPFVLKELEAAKQSDKELAAADFDTALFGHIGFTLSNAARALWLGLSNSRFVKAPVKDDSAGYYRHLTRFCSAFALVTDIAMLILGGDLKRKEKLSGRLADVLSHLYLASACLKRYYDQGQAKEDLPLLRWACENSLFVIQQRLEGFLLNFPNKSVAWLLTRLIFPLGKPFSGPSDNQGRFAAAILLKPSATRDRLTLGMFIPQAAQGPSQDPLGRLEYALHCIINAEAAEKKLRSALQSESIKAGERTQQIQQAQEKNFLDAAEAHLLLTADAARQAALSVDDFAPDSLLKKQQPPEPYLAKESA